MELYLNPSLLVIFYQKLVTQVKMYEMVLKNYKIYF